MRKVLKFLKSPPAGNSDKWYYATIACCAIGVVSDLWAIHQMNKREREWGWTDADSTSVGNLHDVYSERSGDVPPIPPVAGNEVAQPTQEVTDADSGD